MGALRPAFLNRHLGGQNTITSCVRCTGRPLRRAAWPPPRRVSGPRTAPNTACRRPRLVPSRSMPGRASGGAAVARLMGLWTTVQRRSADLEGRARRFYTDVLSELIGRLLRRVCPVVEAYPQQPRNFSLHVDDQVCLPELILEPCVSPLQLAYLLIQRISLRLAAAFLRQDAFVATRYAPPCATSSGARVQALLPQELTHLPGSVHRSASSDLQLVRRTEPPP